MLLGRALLPLMTLLAFALRSVTASLAASLALSPRSEVELEDSASAVHKKRVY
jgi:photosystem II stability/assembly factor-like uncharacterized protein